MSDVHEFHQTGVRRFKPYAKYKDTGVEWLVEIPAHWQVRRLKTIASVELSNVDKKSVEDQMPVRLCNYTDVYYNERITSAIDFMRATAAAEQARRFTLRAGDVLVTKDFESWTDIAVPSVVVDELEGVVCGYHLALVRPFRDCVYGRFLARAFAAVGPRDQFQISANGITRFGLSYEGISTGVFPLPPLDEQRGIIQFLDRETAKIDALVGNPRSPVQIDSSMGRITESMEHLKEYRLALISAAVTGKIDVQKANFGG